MSETFVTTVIDNATGWATITMDRTEVLNAFAATLIAQLPAVLETLAEDNGVAAVVLAGAGKSFSAGADLNWLQRIAGYSENVTYQNRPSRASTARQAAGPSD